MLEINMAGPDDIAYITDISESIFSAKSNIAPEGYDSFRWYSRALETGYIYKIVFDGSLIGGLVCFRTGRFRFQLERIFLLPGFQNLGIGRKCVNYLTKRFPEARVWYSDVNFTWNDYSRFLIACGFFESNCSADDEVRYIKIL